MYLPSGTARVLLYNYNIRISVSVTYGDFLALVSIYISDRVNLLHRYIQAIKFRIRVCHNLHLILFGWLNVNVTL